MHFQKHNSLSIKLKPHLYSARLASNADYDYNSSYLNRILKGFITCPLDKASNNFGIVCLKYYLITVLKEMGYELDEFGNLSFINSNTYSIYNLEKEGLFIERHNRFCSSNNFSNTNIKITLLIYCTPKLQKNPIKFRFITGATGSSIKPIAVELKNVFNFIKAHFKRYVQTIRIRSKNLIGCRAIEDINLVL